MLTTIKSKINCLIRTLTSSRCDKHKECKYFSNDSITCTETHGDYYSIGKKCGAYYR